jgi:hypothetical protein
MNCSEKEENNVDGHLNANGKKKKQQMSGGCLSCVKCDKKKEKCTRENKKDNMF